MTTSRALALALVFWRLFGQSTDRRPSFEVISVKPTPPDRQNYLRNEFCRKGGSFSVGGAPVLWSIRYAYRLRDNEIGGAPDWLTAFDSAYDIEAKPSGPATEDQCRQM